MDLHLKQHSYKLPEELKYKCEDCDYWGPNFLTMQVHTGRCHSENFYYGLCDYKAKSLENLEIHFKTCEVYECVNCYFRVKQISQMKAHMKSKHGNEDIKFVHGKQDRHSKEEVNTTEHLRFELFPQTN